MELGQADCSPALAIETENRGLSPGGSIVTLGVTTANRVVL